jgi:hypothetical protein
MLALVESPGDAGRATAPGATIAIRIAVTYAYRGFTCHTQARPPPL